MKIKISSKLFSLSGTKKIFVDNEEVYITKSETLTNQGKISLIHKESGYVKTILLHEAFFFKDWFHIRLLNKDNVLLKFNRISAYKREYTCFYNNEKYEIRGNLILKNDEAIVNWINYDHSTFPQEDDFEIVSFDNNNLELIISLCLIIHLLESERRSA